MPATWISNENNDWFAKGKYVSKYVLFSGKENIKFHHNRFAKITFTKKNQNLSFILFCSN